MLSKVQILTVNSESAHQRIDNFLIKFFKTVPKSRIYRMVRTGEVRVNKKRVTVAYRLALHDEVRVPPVQVRERVILTPTANAKHELSQRIIFEDDHLIVVNKPCGIPVHAGTGVDYGIINIIQSLYPNNTLSLVHRLDRDTSGCLMIAKNRESLVYLHEALRENRINKSYLALTRGEWTAEELCVTLPLSRDCVVGGERVAVYNEMEGKAAVTQFSVLQTFGCASLVKANLLTGRTHQIRAHAQLSGHPIAGDTKYGDKHFTQLMKEFGLNRLFLHATSLQLRLPNGIQQTITAELDHSLESVLHALSTRYL